MVAVSQGGMQGASMIVRTALDTRPVTSGIQEIIRGFSSIKSDGESVNATFSRIGIVAGSVAKTMVGLGVAGTTAIMGIASKAPAVAPALASMQVSFDRLTRTLGTALRPVFDRMAESFEGFVNWIDENDETIRIWGENAVNYFEGVVTGANSAFSGLKEITGIIGLEVDSKTAGEFSTPIIAGILGKAVLGLSAKVTIPVVLAIQTVGGIQEFVGEHGWGGFINRPYEEVRETLPPILRPFSDIGAKMGEWSREALEWKAYSLSKMLQLNLS